MPEINEFFHNFAAKFAGPFDEARPICYPDLLKRDKLDFSHDSLDYVDEYLSVLHRLKETIQQNEWHTTVLYAGAYVGEVIRNETENFYHWIDYDDYIPHHPDMQRLIPERTTPTTAFLVDDGDRMSMPLNKIARFIEEGDEHSVHFFADCDIAHAQRE